MSKLELPITPAVPENVPTPKTLLDELAGLAMQGILAGNHPVCRTQDCNSDIARESYSLADAMLRERAKYIT